MTAVPGQAGDLVVRRSRRRQRPVLLGLAAFLAFYVVGGLTGFLTGRVVVLGVVVFAIALAVGLVDVVRSGPGSTALLRISPVGVEVPDVASVPWSDLDEVRVVPIRWPPGYSVVAFIPRAGVVLPRIPRSRLSTGAMRGTPAKLASGTAPRWS